MISVGAVMNNAGMVSFLLGSYLPESISAESRGKCLFKFVNVCLNLKCLFKLNYKAVLQSGCAMLYLSTMSPVPPRLY